MPCESCHLQFTVFRRKRICHECRCFYCGNCLTTTRRSSVLCRRCAIFAQRPISRTDLLQLKPKDLIFYLQSKHISTAGCVEKEELVCLVLNYLEQSGDLNTPNDQSSPGAEQSNSFDSLKQTCQNFFSNLSDNISDSFSTFDSKNPAKTTDYRRRSSRENGHIFEQPRVNTREIPTYASSQNVQFPASSQATTASQNNSESIRISDRNENSNQLRSRLQSPSSPTAPHTTTPLNSHKPLNKRSEASTTQQHIEDEKSDCECSDDEIINNFSERMTAKTENSGQAVLSRPTNDSGLTGLAPSTTTSTSPGYSKQDSLSSKVDMGGIEVSSQSSFEELGAIGGISDESKAATDTTSGSNIDQWQILDTAASDNLMAAAESSTTDEIIKVTFHDNTNPVEPIDNQQQQIRHPTVPQRTKKVVRRRSDGYLNKRNHSSDEELPIDGVKLTTLREHVDDSMCEQQSGCCPRCGKNRTNIRRHVERMRRHLESSQMSEEEIKRELQEFLNYLEQRTKSIDCSDLESRAVSSLSGGVVDCANGGNVLITPTIEFSPTVETMQFDENEGIHVYAAPEGYEATYSGMDSRFINLDDFEDFKDLENLTVKQLKEVLMLHRVDYKGCCEKQELLDRVGRLWKNKRSSPAVDKLATDELCKICMDAPIECVFLECGHMATCTNCGKVLNECPICRQYIVRVVRFFRA